MSSRVLLSRSKIKIRQWNCHVLSCRVLSIMQLENKVWSYRTSIISFLSPQIFSHFLLFHSKMKVDHGTVMFSCRSHVFPLSIIPLENKVWSHKNSIQSNLSTFALPSFTSSQISLKMNPRIIFTYKNLKSSQLSPFPPNSIDVNYARSDFTSKFS
jgi:hypothetical protein